MNIANDLKKPAKPGSTLISIDLRALSNLLKKGIQVPKIILKMPRPSTDTKPRGYRTAAHPEWPIKMPSWGMSASESRFNTLN